MTWLGDPKRMRASVNRKGFGYDDPIGQYRANSGRLVNVTWTTCSQTHCHVVVWDENDPSVLEVARNVVRVNAAPQSEAMLARL